MNERQVKDLLEFLLVVINKFDERYHYMRVEVVERLEALAARQILFQEEIRKMFDSETTRIAQVIEDLIATGGDKDDPEFMAALNATLDGLKKVGAGGTVPTPPVPPGV
jgi:hypothetical protein